MPCSLTQTFRLKSMQRPHQGAILAIGELVDLNTGDKARYAGLPLTFRLFDFLLPWFPSLVPFLGSHSWFPFLVPILGSHSWFPFLVSLLFCLLSLLRFPHPIYSF